jgi:hypothetical protein
MSRLHAINKEIEACERELGMMGARYLGSNITQQEESINISELPNDIIECVLKELDHHVLLNVLSTMSLYKTESIEAVRHARTNTSNVESLCGRLLESIHSFLLGAVTECTFSYETHRRGDKTLRHVSVYVHNNANASQKSEIIRIRPMIPEGFIVCHCRCLSANKIRTFADGDPVVKARLYDRPLFLFESLEKAGSTGTHAFNTEYINGSGMLVIGENRLPYQHGIEGRFMKVLKALYSRDITSQLPFILSDGKDPRLPDELFAPLFPIEPHGDETETGHPLFGSEHRETKRDFDQYSVNHAVWESYRPIGEFFEDIP